MRFRGGDITPGHLHTILQHVQRMHNDGGHGPVGDTKTFVVVMAVMWPCRSFLRSQSAVEELDVRRYRHGFAHGDVSMFLQAESSVAHRRYEPYGATQKEKK